MKGHIQKRSDDAWRLKYDIGRDPLTGKRKTAYKTFHGNKRAAQKELTRLLNERHEGGYIEPNKTTLAQYLVQWLTSIRPSVSPTTWETWDIMARKNIIPEIGEIPLAHLSTLDLDTYYAKALQEGRRHSEGGLSAQTVLHHHRMLHQALKRAVRKRLIRDNPAQFADAPKPAAREIEFLTEDEIADLLKAIEHTRMHFPVLLAVSTGMRRGELLALRWRDVNLDGMILTVNQALIDTRDGLKIKSPKTRKSRRSITLPATVVDALRRHKVRHLEERVMLGLGRDDNALVICKPGASPTGRKTFQGTFPGSLPIGASARFHSMP